MPTPTIPTRKISGENLWGHIAALIAVVMWGYSFVSSKVLLENGLGPMQIYVYRWVLAYISMVCISHKKLFSASLHEEWMFCLCALCAGTLYFFAENTALEYTLTTNVSLLTSLSPLVTAFLVGLVYKTERIGVGMWIGSVVAIGGVVCVVLNSSTSLQVRPLGDFLALSAAFSWAVYSLILRRLNANYDVWFITRKTFFYGLVTAIPFLFFEKDNAPFMEVIVRPEVYGNLLFLGLGASTIAFAVWAIAIKNIGALKANNYMYLQPIVTLVVSAIILHEYVTIVGYIGIALILAGLWVGENIDKKYKRRS
ncbi:MAG: DMT family transporter [Muribaculaceae bacterium]|nr:DMT family transporter [Muribaculaceae bacterium]